MIKQFDVSSCEWHRGRNLSRETWGIPTMKKSNCGQIKMAAWRSTSACYLNKYNWAHLLGPRGLSVCIISNHHEKRLHNLSNIYTVFFFSQFVLKKHYSWGELSCWGSPSSGLSVYYRFSWIYEVAYLYIYTPICNCTYIVSSLFADCLHLLPFEPQKSRVPRSKQFLFKEQHARQQSYHIAEEPPPSNSSAKRWDLETVTVQKRKTRSSDVKPGVGFGGWAAAIRWHTAPKLHLTDHGWGALILQSFPHTSNPILLPHFLSPAGCWTHTRANSFR